MCMEEHILLEEESLESIVFPFVCERSTYDPIERQFIINEAQRKITMKSYINQAQYQQYCDVALKEVICQSMAAPCADSIIASSKIFASIKAYKLVKR